MRCHPPPNMHKMTELSTTAAELGFELDTSGAGAGRSWPFFWRLCGMTELSTTATELGSELNTSGACKGVRLQGV